MRYLTDDEKALFDDRDDKRQVLELFVAAPSKEYSLPTTVTIQALADEAFIVEKIVFGDIFKSGAKVWLSFRGNAPGVSLGDVVAAGIYVTYQVEFTKRRDCWIKVFGKT